MCRLVGNTVESYNPRGAVRTAQSSSLQIRGNLSTNDKWASECLAGTPPPVSWRWKPLTRLGPSRKQTSRFLSQHWRRCRGTLSQTLLMAEPPVNNRKTAQMQDGCTTSDSGSNNGRRDGRNRPTSSRRPSPRQAVSQVPFPRRLASQIHIPVRDRDHGSAYDIMGIVTRLLGRLD
ncbi:hypothetical protein PIB30_039313 [Stylosanthes scabra]|uniref:Uncharacterized protein n=1 Tax=Stylosanthes scabra TaxID=79078 RepID=A0ABU6QDT9_9FABA|nr:hypothetical protein [Stylosanthes scabra]